MTALTGNMQWETGRAPADYAATARGLSSEDLISRDALFMRLDQEMAARQATMLTAMQAVTNARRALQPHYTNLKAKVTAFQTYITAKKKSTLNPFKKKSVGNAERVITQANTFLQACQIAARPN
ncbi:MAG: hypothetical protein IT168_31845 [Bryobacterales bacterium]|nr:hypothetical protein [Bryobacterales bacterium]